MTKTAIPTTPDEFAALLTALFPPFAAEWATSVTDRKGQVTEIGYDIGTTFHQVLQAFAPISFKLMSASTSRQVESFCQIINQAVSEPGSLENAISTCLLEHASQLGIRKILQPHLSQAAKKTLR